jgi:hypothetical protein
MEWTSLHPLDANMVGAYLDRIRAAAPQSDSLHSGAGEQGVNVLTLGFARFLAEGSPVFVHDGLSLTTFEARIDRGVGMLLRPPSRLFMDAGLDASIACAMPIRLDLQQGNMGGAFVPARLIPQMRTILDERMQRILRRLDEAEYDGVAVLGLLIEATDYAAARGLGLYEAIDAISPYHPASWPPGATVLAADPKRLDRDLRKRLETAAKPEKQPGLIRRMFGRPGGS